MFLFPSVVAIGICILSTCIVNNVSLEDGDFSGDSDSHTKKFTLKAMFLFPLVVARYVFFLLVL